MTQMEERAEISKPLGDVFVVGVEVEFALQFSQRLARLGLRFVVRSALQMGVNQSNDNLRSYSPHSVRHCPWMCCSASSPYDVSGSGRSCPLHPELHPANCSFKYHWKSKFTANCSILISYPLRSAHVTWNHTLQPGAVHFMQAPWRRSQITHLKRKKLVFCRFWFIKIIKNRNAKLFFY